MPTSTGEVHFIRYRDTWRRRITSTLTQLSAHFGALTAAAMAARLLPLQLTLSLYSHVHFTLSTLTLTKHASFIGNSWQPSPAIARGQ
jgi:hypothetical protein